jgi:hypothetical protein
MNTMLFRRWIFAAAIASLILSHSALAQRDVHWQINPIGFPSSASVFVDVAEQGVYRNNLTAASFKVTMDEFAEEQGGWILNQQQVAAGSAGAQILIIVDISSTYTGEFAEAKKVANSLISEMDPTRDQIAIATAPTNVSSENAKLDVPFSSDPAMLTAALNNIKTLSSKDRSAPRISKAISAGLRFFPVKTTDKYRAIVFITGGIDKDEGKSDCINDSYKKGLVPVFPIVFKLDRKYDSAKSYKIENATLELAEKTGGRSIYRKGQNSNAQFIAAFWNRIRNLYHLLVMFPCYKPQVIEHYSLLKVEERDAEPIKLIKFEATSTPAPTPTITALYPPYADSKAVEDGKVELTIDGTGFCGPAASMKVAVNGAFAPVKSLNPFRTTVTLNATHKTGKVTVTNRFGETGESAVKFQVTEPPKGAQTMNTLTYLVIGIVGFALLSIIVVALKSRKAKPAAVKKTIPKPRKSDVPSKEAASAKTMAMSTIDEAWAELVDGIKVSLDEGDNLIGREETCKIQITAGGASREHARIQFDKSHGLIWVEDLGSTNGTFYGKGHMNEQEAAKLEKRQLVSAGDAIWVAGQKIVVRFNGGVGGEG